MKKFINSIVAFGALVSIASCDLNQEPPLGPGGDELTTFEYMSGLRLGNYNNIKGVCSGGFLFYPDLFCDVVTETYAAMGSGAAFYRWLLYSTDGDISSIWSAYYGTINQINYSIMRMEEYIENQYEQYQRVEPFIGEMKFFRAYVLHQIALRFCEDYDPDRADSQLGVPVLIEYNAETFPNLPRGTLKQVYDQIQEDVDAAWSALQNVQGSQDAIYVTADAVMAFRAQIALQMHEYEDAHTYASSLFARYPLAERKEDLEQMWLRDTSTETIFQPEVNLTTLGSVSSMAIYMSAVWDEADNSYVCSPAYVPEGKVVRLYIPVGQERNIQDWRYGVYIDSMNINVIGRPANGVLLTKFAGNEAFRTQSTTLGYRNRPKVFRIAQMYLLDAEALYRDNQPDAARESLNALREARGLQALESSVAGTDLWAQIKDEYMRELIGEGHRLTDIKRWGEKDIARNIQTSLNNDVILPQGTNTKNFADEEWSRFVWPIPSTEISNNPNFGAQNPGYGN